MAKSCQLHAGIFLLALVCLQSGAGARVVGRLLSQAVHAVGPRKVALWSAYCACTAAKSTHATRDLDPRLICCCCPGCQAFPELFAAKHAKTSCIDHPSSFHSYGSHGRLVMDG